MELCPTDEIIDDMKTRKFMDKSKKDSIIYYLKKYNEQKKQIIELEGKISRSSINNDLLRKKNSELFIFQDDYEQKQKLNEELVKINKILKKKNSKFAEKIEILENSESSLLDKNNFFEKKLNKLINQNNDLTEKNKFLTEQNNNLTEQNIYLTEQNNSLTEKLDNFLTFENEEIKKFCDKQKKNLKEFFGDIKNSDLISPSSDSFDLISPSTDSNTDDEILKFYNKKRKFFQLY